MICNETLDDVINRHKKETKELLAKTTALKKTATKGEKKKKKEISKQVEDLEKELRLKHEEELRSIKEGNNDKDRIGGDNNGNKDQKKGLDADDALKTSGFVESDGVKFGNVGPDTVEDDPSDDLANQLLAEMSLNESTTTASNGKQPAVSPQVKSGPKKNRRKEKLAKRKQEEQQIYEEAQNEASNQPDLRKIELDNITLLCDKQNLIQQEIAADGHCLFASISDQLKHRHGINKSVQSLRNDAAQYIRSDPDTFSPFLFDETTMSIKDLDSYCTELVETPVWGGDMEILALAKSYDCPISILFSGRPTMIMNEEGNKPMLKLVYYKHSFGLGEHYNSLRDKVGDKGGGTDGGQRDD